jgi:hypothetical protein
VEKLNFIHRFNLYGAIRETRCQLWLCAHSATRRFCLYDETTLRPFTRTNRSPTYLIVGIRNSGGIAQMVRVTSSPHSQPYEHGRKKPLVDCRIAQAIPSRVVNPTGRHVFNCYLGEGADSICLLGWRPLQTKPLLSEAKWYVAPR